MFVWMYVRKIVMFSRESFNLTGRVSDSILSQKYFRELDGCIPSYSSTLSLLNLFDYLLRGFCTPNLKLACFVCYLKIINSFSKNDRGGFRGGRILRAPPLFFAEIGRLTLCGRPRQKECAKSCKLDFENYIFSPLLRGCIPLKHPLSPHARKFCKSLILAPPLLKNPGSAPE